MKHNKSASNDKTNHRFKITKSRQTSHCRQNILYINPPIQSIYHKQSGNYSLVLPNLPLFYHLRLIKTEYCNQILCFHRTLFICIKFFYTIIIKLLFISIHIYIINDNIDIRNTVFFFLLNKL